MAKAISLKTLASKKYAEFEFTGVYQDVFGNPEKGSLWLVYGKEKQGKTTFSLRLAEYMSPNHVGTPKKNQCTSESTLIFCKGMVI